ncbi:MAG: DUF1553 domain-containing protein [Prosthecobacter sp.]
MRPLRLFLPLLTTPALLSAAPVDFVREVRPILEKHCTSCHGEKKQKSGLRLDLKAAALTGGDKHGPDIVAGKAKDSPLIQFLTSADEDELMPPKGRISQAEIDLLTRWINEGAVWPDGVDVAKVEDRMDHWAFKPTSEPKVPSLKLQVSSSSTETTPASEAATLNFKPETLNSASAAIDAFIDAKLTEKGLHRSPPADPVTWLRRVTLDLTGLPPTPEEVAAFFDPSDRSDQTDLEKYTAVVDRLLQSPRYGERWAQHWLDVVRYADTHGFEVNTERPNAWPYRDYVIRAFNDDTPYDRFIQEQIVGDALGQDAATGFLVTASVLLPGQIGKDEASKRLARQDSLDEIVVNIGQTFLGLSVGCARCHDHKFDPVSARDYYAMQAMIAGVAYGDRDLNTPEASATREQVRKIKAELAGIDKQLANFIPLAKAGGRRPMVNARENRDRFAPVQARRMRFTIRQTNNREPCIDELEVFDTKGGNIALASLGTKATSSGDTIVANRHDLANINDGKHGNSHSWMSNEKGKGWVMLEFPALHEIDRVVWARDRQGKYDDRLAISYVIETADDSGTWRVVADSDDRQKFDERERTPPALALQGFSKEETATAKKLLGQKAPLEKQVQALESTLRVFAGSFREPDDIHLLNRGDPEQPKERVTPAVLSKLGSVALPHEATDAQRREALAKWIASPQNPLTARVMVNRIWQGHFGTGIVETPSDFGRSGMKPTHPELLDWLAAEFVRSGWSVKHMHRAIVLSETYRQSSSVEPAAESKEHGARSMAQTSAAALKDTTTHSLPHAPGSTPSGSSPPAPSPMLVDSECRLLWRYPSRRIDAETLRDSMLAVSGQLNTKMYGRGYDLFDKRGGLSGFTPVESFKGEGLRRLIYAHKVRREREAVFGAFDCPDAGQSTARRRESTTPIQALNLFNSRFTLEQSEAFAARVTKEAGDADATKQISHAYQLALCREASAGELREMVPIVQEGGLAALCRALFNSNEFLFVR